MTKTTTRARSTLEFKHEAVRLVEGGQSIAASARALGVVDQTLFNWVGRTGPANSQGLTARSSAPSRWRSAACGPSLTATDPRP